MQAQSVSNELQIINEPTTTAIAYAYGLDRDTGGQIVCDVGGRRWEAGRDPAGDELSPSLPSHF